MPPLPVSSSGRRGPIARLVLALALLTPPAFAGVAVAEGAVQAAGAWPVQRELRYDSPAQEWTAALPVGNGRLGAMVFGAYPRERIQLNEDSLWAIDPLVRHPDETKDHIARVQEWVDAGRFAEADALYRDKVILKNEGRVGSYQTMGDLAIEHVDSPAGEAGGYHRQLDLATGLTTARQVRIDGSIITEQVLASAVDHCIAIRLETTAAAGLSFDVSLTRPTQRNCSARAKGADTLELEQHNRNAENDAAMQYIRAEKSRPFFVYLAPHNPCSLPDSQWALPVGRVKLKIGGSVQKAVIEDNAKASIFTAHLNAGPTETEARLLDSQGQSLGAACYVYVQRSR